MNKEEFLSKLKEDLHALTEEERLNGLKYYEEYFGGKIDEAKNIEKIEEIKEIADIESREIGEISNVNFAVQYVQHGGWIYYSDENGLYKKRKNGKGITKLADKTSWSIIVVGEWLFYLCEDGLFKTRTDGAITESVVHIRNPDIQRIIRIVNVTGKQLFYLKYFSGDKEDINLCKIKTDGKRDKNLDNNISFAVVSDNRIFYSKIDGGLYKISGSGKGKKKLCDDKTDYIYIRKYFPSWVYYHNLSDGGKPYKIRKDGKKRQTLK